MLEEARSFEEARRILSESPIPCDCLLLLSGIASGQMAVIERTPSRHAIRAGEAGFVCVTNAYEKLDAAQGSAPAELLESSCPRLQRIQTLIGKRQPITADDCLRYLSDPGILMNMTMQQMVFQATSGRSWIDSSIAMS